MDDLLNAKEELWAKGKKSSVGKYIAKWNDWVPNKGLLNLALLSLIRTLITFSSSSVWLSSLFTLDQSAVQSYTLVQRALSMFSVSHKSNLFEDELVWLSNVAVLISERNSTMQWLPVLHNHTNAWQKLESYLAMACQIIVLCYVKVIKQVSNISFERRASYSHIYVCIYTHMHTYTFSLFLMSWWPVLCLFG